MTNLKYIRTEGGVHLMLDNKPYNVAKSDTERYEAVMAAIKEGRSEEEVLAILEAEKRRVEAAVGLDGDVTLRGGVLYYQGEEMNGVLADRILAMVEEGFDVSPMTNFLKNLMRNPSARVVQHLYAFLEHGKNPLTPDGHFLAYKAVRADFKDIHSGKFDNSVGAVVEMQRNQVDEDPNRTCSSGLHVCSFDYLEHFSHADGHVVVCKINPADVVAIPADYNNTKMRVCRYEVVAEHAGYYEAKREKARADVLAQSTVSESGEGAMFEVVTHYEDTEQTEVYGSLLAAAEAMEDALDDSDVSRVVLRNRRTGIVLDDRQNDDFVSSRDDDDESTDARYRVDYIDDQGNNVDTERYDDLDEALNAALESDMTTVEVRDDHDGGRLIRRLTS